MPRPLSVTAISTQRPSGDGATDTSIHDGCLSSADSALVIRFSIAHASSSELWRTGGTGW